MYTTIVITICIVCCIYMIINWLYIRSKQRYLKEIGIIQLKYKNIEGNKAPQGVATSRNYIFIIYPQAIEKYNKQTKKLLKTVNFNFVTHLNSGVVRDNILYCVDGPLSKDYHLNSL